MHPCSTYKFRSVERLPEPDIEEPPLARSTPPPEEPPAHANGISGGAGHHGIKMAIEAMKMLPAAGDDDSRREDLLVDRAMRTVAEANRRWELTRDHRSSFGQVSDLSPHRRTNFGLVTDFDQHLSVLKELFSANKVSLAKAALTSRRLNSRMDAVLGEINTMRKEDVVHFK